jgi:hypothetical protein
MLQFKVKKVGEAIDPMALSAVGVDYGNLGFPTVETDQIMGPLCPPPRDRRSVARRAATPLDAGRGILLWRWIDIESEFGELKRSGEYRVFLSV